ncbi:hypothetical protein [Agromyces seonyuensis]|uniref:Uncharacterized protein n=1 Tax=Agromyces seonyuensis TaxID=2662446 RepID=A0A6I4P7W3_9MICO|nr:hypothetical protein [Agromyces seonyuensis]MWC00005.1 hypothetical protein [Agromyces seonyuensis]
MTTPVLHPQQGAPAPEPERTPTATAPARARSGGLIALIAGSGGFVVLVIALVFLVVTPRALVVPPIPDEAVAAAAEGAAPGEALFGELNAALESQDREAFFARVSGDAVAPLTLWWDNMEQLGWTSAAMSGDEYDVPWSDGSVEVPVVLGASLAFAAFAPRGSGGDDAGKHFVQGFRYVASVDVVDEVATITGWRTDGPKAAWDFEPLYVARGEHVLIAGRQSEQALVDSLVAEADEAAAWVLDDAEAQGRDLPLDGFNVFATDDQSIFDTWFVDEATAGWQMEAAAYAVPTTRPESWTEGMDTTIATGDSTSTSVVFLGPSAMEQLDGTLPHEFEHVMHYTAVPSSWSDPPRVTVEGWATYQENRRLYDGAYAPADSQAILELSWCYDNMSSSGIADLAPEQFYVEDAFCYYQFGASMFAYLDSLGVDAWDVADAAKFDGVDPLTAAAAQGADVSEAAWQAWVDQQTAGVVAVRY